MICIAGGGLAGLTCAIVLSKNGFEVTVIEKREYPFHRVCGEYVSNEVKPYLLSLGINVEELGASAISSLKVSSPTGSILQAGLDSGGFGVSRYKLDHFLYQKALASGVKFLLNTKVIDIRFCDDHFETETDKYGLIHAGLVIAAYGKRSNLDQKLGRSFFYRRSPYFAVKYHIKTDFPNNVTQLDNFEGGYCGINKVEGDIYNLCYLSLNKNLKKYGNLESFTENVLFRNPHLKERFRNSDFIFDKPLVINEISFEKKDVVEDHILFCGDAVGMITPLCGNGMAMAVRGAKILTGQIIRHPNYREPHQRQKLENGYQREWLDSFSLRLKTGRIIQSFFGNNASSEIAVSLLRRLPGLTRMLIKKTHGAPF